MNNEDGPLFFDPFEIESTVLKFWKENKIFDRSLDQTKNSEEFVFYDGPPFANGMPHYGHILTGVIKDCVARHRTMSGFLVRRRWGWDCHGLPSEMAASKELGLNGCSDILKFGVKNFNEKCRSEVMKYAHKWQEYVDRQGRWVQFDNAYKTMDLSYMESVIWAFKTLYKKGLIYEGYKVVPYSWACETPISNFETRLDNSYRTKISKAATVLFELDDIPKSLRTSAKIAYMVAWTTTPWTLVGNLALAISDQIKYIASVSSDGIAYIFAENRRCQVENLYCGEEFIQHDLAFYEIVGLKYKPIYDYFADQHNGFKVLKASFVSDAEGTGIVHVAPGFGEEDFNLCKENNIEIVCPVDGFGKYTHDVTDFVGRNVFEAEPDLIRELSISNVIVKIESYSHQYPYCWRTDTPLIYKAVSSWYLAVTKISGRMQELNADVNWIPQSIRDGLFGGWIANAKDWAISRSRFFGVPVPVWRSNNPAFPRIDVYGSIKEIEQDFDIKIDSLHIENIDPLTRPNPSDPTGLSQMVRVREVLDCWFESGSMPFAEIHYPFSQENNHSFFQSTSNADFLPIRRIPADFVAEYIAQTRGWFYTLFVISVALFDVAPFKNCVCHGVVLAADGKKLSKRLGNYEDPLIVMNKYGADSLRWAMLVSGVFAGSDLRLSDKYLELIEAQKVVMRPLWSAVNFFNLYAAADLPKTSLRWEFKNVFDQYIVLEAFSLMQMVISALNEYKFAKACAYIPEFIELMNNWYIRCNRKRFWKGPCDDDRLNGYDALYTALICLCCALAPIAPFMAEYSFQTIGRVPFADSVHLMKYEDIVKRCNELEDKNNIVLQMRFAKGVVEATNKLRDKAKIRTRQPLKSLTIIGGELLQNDVLLAIRNEANVIKVITKAEDERLLPSLKIRFAILAKRIPEKVQNIVQNKKDFKIVEQEVWVAGEQLFEDEFDLDLQVEDENSMSLIRNYPMSAIIVDLEIDEDLMMAGLLRDFTRGIQIHRKAMGLKPSDMIKILVCENEILSKDLLLSLSIDEASQIVVVEKANDEFVDMDIANSSISVCIVKESK